MRGNHRRTERYEGKHRMSKTLKFHICARSWGLCKNPQDKSLGDQAHVCGEESGHKGNHICVDCGATSR